MALKRNEQFRKFSLSGVFSRALVCYAAIDNGYEKGWEIEVKPEDLAAHDLLGQDTAILDAADKKVDPLYQEWLASLPAEQVRLVVGAKSSKEIGGIL